MNKKQRAEKEEKDQKQHIPNSGQSWEEIEGRTLNEIEIIRWRLEQTRKKMEIKARTTNQMNELLNWKKFVATGRK